MNDTPACGNKGRQFSIIVESSSVRMTLSGPPTSLASSTERSVKKFYLLIPGRRPAFTIALEVTLYSMGFAAQLGRRLSIAYNPVDYHIHCFHANRQTM